MAGCFSSTSWGAAGCGCGCAAVTFVTTCQGADLGGATVTVEDGGGQAVAAGTTDGAGRVTLSIPAAGTYTVVATAAGKPGYSAAMALACGGQYTLDLCCPVTVCVSNAGFVPLVGAAVAILSTADGSTVASGTTDANGCVTLDVGAAGTYELTASLSGYVPYDATLALTCPDQVHVILCPTGQAVTFSVTGCGVAQPGATVAFAGQTKVTDASGQAVFGVPAVGAYDWSVVQRRYQTATGTFTLTAPCQFGQVNAVLTPADGYHCGCNSATNYLPYPTDLHGTDSCLGAVAMTYGGDGVGNYWYGELAVTNSGCQCGAVNSPAQNITTVRYYWPSGSGGQSGAGNCGGAVGFCPVVLVNVPAGSTGGNNCQSACAVPGDYQFPQSTTQAGPELSVTSTYAGCLPCQTVIGHPQGSCTAPVPVWQCETITFTLTE